MPLFIQTFAILSSQLLVSIFGTAVIGANYFSPILFHLADQNEVNNVTNTIASLNAPNWAIGAPFTTPTATSVASSSFPTAASGLASSTTFFFAVAALDANGTSTLSNTLSFTTDASNTQPSPEQLSIKWGPIAGATGYAIFFGASANALNNYFLATTTSQYTFSTSSGSLAGSYTKADTTGYTTLINPNGTSFFNGANGTATTTVASSTAVEVNGSVRAQSNGTTTSCYTATRGQMFFNTQNGKEWGCNGSAWVAIF